MLLDTMESRCNRRRTELEKEIHLPQDKPVTNQPWFQMAVIRMNSTYLECVDRMFEERGFLTFAGMLLLAGMLIFPAVIAGDIIEEIRIHPSSPCYGEIRPVKDGFIDICFGSPSYKKWEKDPDAWLEGYVKKELETILIYFAVTSPVFIMFWMFLIGQECFRYTHFPIRFNRKKRKVHFFRNDGTTLTVDWDKLYFTIIPQAGRRRRPGALIMEGETVKEFFALPFVTIEGDPLLCSFYEFVRRYMEGDDETVAELAKQIMYAPDIVDRREGYWDGVDYLHDVSTGGRGFLRALYPFAMGLGIFRWIVMHTSRIPRWPKEVEVDCAFPPDDPNIRDAQHLSPPVLQAPAIT